MTPGLTPAWLKVMGPGVGDSPELRKCPKGPKPDGRLKEAGTLNVNMRKKSTWSSGVELEGPGIV